MNKIFEKYHIYPGIMFALSFAFAYLLLNAHLWRSLITDKNSDPSIGQFSTVKNEVRARAQNSVAWQEAINDDVVRKGDVVATGPNSEATVYIEGFGSIRLAANSLVAIGLANNQPVFDVQVGSVEAAVNKGQSLQIKNRDKLTKIEAPSDLTAKVEITSSTEELTIKNMSTDTPLTVDSVTAAPDEIVKTAQTETVELNTIEIPLEPEFYAPPVSKDDSKEASKVEEVVKIIRDESIKLLAAANQFVLQFKNLHLSRKTASQDLALLNPPTLKWSGGAAPYTIEISSDKKFKKINHQYTTLENSFDWSEAKVGSYFWRVRSADQLTVSSVGVINSIYPNIELHLPAEYTETVYSIKEYETKVLDLPISWHALPNVNQYRFVVREAKNDSAKTTTNISRNMASLSTVKPGAIETRIIALGNQNNLLSQTGPYHNIEFKKNLVLAKPSLVFPPNNAEITSFWEKKDEPLVLAWQPGEEGLEYEIEASKDISFTDSIQLEKTKSANKLISKLPQSTKTVYWRVRSTYKNFSSEWSTPRRFKIK